jgi:ribosomal protein L11 methyltransferase
MVIACKKKGYVKLYWLPLYHIEPRELGSEILIAELGKPHFESFTETETGISDLCKRMG